jgi:TPP-dependent pyruvate/acetoin dehydrogenase alpha subunit
MVVAGTLTVDEWEAMEKDVAAIVQDAWDFADASPEPPAAALYEDVLVDTTS